MCAENLDGRQLSTQLLLLGFCWYCLICCCPCCCCCLRCCLRCCCLRCCYLCCATISQNACLLCTENFEHFSLQLFLLNQCFTLLCSRQFSAFPTSYGNSCFYLLLFQFCLYFLATCLRFKVLPSRVAE